MKRNILNLLLVTVVLVLTACGSNSKRDPIVLDRNVTADGNSTVYHLVNETRVVEVNFANQVKTISVDVVDGQNVGISGVNVSISAVSGLEYGSITGASTVSTNDGGRAIFTYNAPKDIDSVNGQDTTVTLSLTLNGRTISKNVQILFKVLDIEVSEITLINETKFLEVHANNEVRNISVDVVNGNGIGVKGKEVSISAISGMEYGAITGASTVTTDGAGRAIFTYTAPNDISTVEGKSTTVTLSTRKEDNSTIAREVTITFKKQIENNGTSVPVVIAPKQTISLTSNSQTVQLEIRVLDQATNRPYTTGNVLVIMPKKVLDNIDVGTFASSSVAVENGRAIFDYTGPADLKSLIANNDLSSVFKFSHEANTQSEVAITVTYELKDPYVPSNYELITSTQDGNQTMGLLAQKTFSIFLKNDKGDLVSDSQINKVTIRSVNATVGKLINAGATVDTLAFTGANAINNKSFVVATFKLSGLLPINIKVDFTDANGKAQSLSTIMNVIVFSGPPTAISISYVSTTQDAGRAKYIEKLAISVTDEYGNRVNTNPSIAVGAIAGYTVDGRESSGVETHLTRRLFYGRQDVASGSANGEIVPSAGNKARFVADPSGVFKYVNAEGSNSDKLVIFGERKNYEAMGKWDFAKDGNSILALQDNYYGIQRSGLYYAVGHNYYQDLCRADGREWLGNADSDTYTVDDKGTATVNYSYDYHLTGKDVLIWVNLDGFQPDTGKRTRIGEVTKHTLRGTGLTKVPSAGYSLAKGESGTAHFVIWHENAPERYRNAHFAWAIKGGSTCTPTLVATSNNFDARTCSNGASSDGTSYVTYAIQAPADKECTFNIERITVSSEF
ncbi:MAG TPA: hypothetical protein EYG82_05955 [Sulfurovum sp.]|nr:hypothetical protein [Sulfurovum sp.]